LEKFLNMNFICREIQHYYGVIGGTLKINPVTQEKYVSGRNCTACGMKVYYNATMM
jgi:hypothetical protein